MESCLANISSILDETKKGSYANLETIYYSYEDMTPEMLNSYKVACKVSGNSRYAYGKTLDPNKSEVFFATFKDSNNKYCSVNKATFSGNNYMPSNAKILEATKQLTPYLYWTLFELCL